MKIVYLLIVASFSSFAMLLLYWRFAVRRRSLPCPSWLPWMLENPYMNALAGAATILSRIGLAPGMKLLDVGCGVGRLTLPAAQYVGCDGEVVGLDIQPGMLRQVEQKMKQAKLHNIRLMQAGIGEGALKADEFDRALLVTVLGEIPDRAAAISKIFHTLKPGGVLSVSEVLPDPHYQTRGTVRRLAREAGFEELSSFGNLLAFTLNFIKPMSIPEVRQPTL